MIVLIDTNVALDVILKREPFFESAQLVMLASERNYIRGFITASAITDIFYVTNKYLKDKAAARNLLKEHLMGSVNVATVDGNVIYRALDMEWDDFEDCVQYVVGESISADYIVTRNPKDFSEGEIKVASPEELINSGANWATFKLDSIVKALNS